MNTDYNAIELRVMKKILMEGNTDHAILMDQYSNQLCVQREVNKCGWYTYFTIKANTPTIIEKKQMHIGNIIVPVLGMEYGIGFVLHVENGQIDTLEAYTFDEYLPDYFEIKTE